MILSHFGKPSQYLPWCMIIWGILSVCTGATFFKIFWSQTKRFSRQVLQLSSYLHLEFYNSHNSTQAISVLYVHGSSLDLWKQHSSLVLWYVGFISTFFISKPFSSSSSRNGTNGMNYLKGQPFFRAASFSATRSGLSLLQQSLTLWKGSLGIQRGGMIILFM